MLAAAFTMAITVFIYVRSSIRRARFEAEMEREMRIQEFNRPRGQSSPPP